MFHSANAIIIYLSLTRILSPYFKSRTTVITGILDNERLWTNQGEKFIQKCKNFSPSINPSYDVHHVHESQSDGMDHQWLQNTIPTDIIKMTFLYIISHYIYYYHLSPWYILWCENMITLKTLISFHINAIWPE